MAEASRDEIKVRKNAIESKLNIIESINETLYGILNEDELAAETTADTDYYLTVQVAVASLERREERNAGANLFAVPAFDGNPTNWVTFWDSFKRSVHDNENMTDSQKLASLKGLVTGKAKKLIQRSSNYESAIKLLTDRCGQPGIRKAALVTDWCKLRFPPCEDAAARESFYDSATKLLQTIENEHITREEMCGIILLNKLPLPLKEFMWRDLNDQVLDCQQLLEKLHL